MQNKSSDAQIRRLIMDSSTDFDMSIVCCGYQPDPTQKLPERRSHTWGPIIRDYYTINYYMRGSGTLIVNDIPISLGPGQCTATLPGTVIVERTERPEPWEFYYLYLKGSKVSLFLRSWGISELNPLFPWRDQASVLSWFRELTELQKSDSPKKLFLQISSLCRLFGELTDLCGTHVRLAERKLSDSYIDKALRYFDSNYHQRISIEEIANSLGFSRAYFTRIFKERMCMTPKEYLIRLRMKKACEFLAVSNATVSDVANSVGYDPFVFSRVFKQTLGVSPIEYKRRLNI